MGVVGVYRKAVVSRPLRPWLCSSSSSSGSTFFFRISLRNYSDLNNLKDGLLLLSKKSRPSIILGQAVRADGGGEQHQQNNNNNYLEKPKPDADADDGSPSSLPLPVLLDNGIISACFVGLLTGISVVLFNNLVHGIRDICWDGIPFRGASWLREEPHGEMWARVILVPTCGGLAVSMLNMLRGALDVPREGNLTYNINAILEPILKALAACVTLGTGNSLGPEGPSVEIGASLAKGVGSLFDRGAQRKISLRAAGSAAGIASGFNAAVAGCFFAVESVLWPSPAESSLTLTNTTSTVILSSVIASVVSEIGLGSEPAFTVPDYDFRSPSELPLYLLLGVICGLVSLCLSWCTSFMVIAIDSIQKNLDMPKAAFPVLGGLAVGLIALAYPEVLYWGFENVDTLLESRPFVKGLSADLLLQLIAVKIVATSLCRASGLVGGYYAPSLFIGAATGMAYGKIFSFLISQPNSIFPFSGLEVASPQAYGLVGMAATLSGVCQVPLTAVLLLFELTQDYRIVLPLLGAVGLSSWITSGYTRGGKKILEDIKAASQRHEALSYRPSTHASSNSCAVNGSSKGTFGLYGNDSNTKDLAKKLLVSQVMRTRYVTVLMSTTLTEVVTRMLAEKQSCAMIVDDKSLLIGFLTLGDIEEFCKMSRERSRKPEELMVSEVCSVNENKCRVPWIITPGMDLISAEMIMNTCGASQLPVTLENDEDRPGFLVGLLDRECISVACRALSTRECLLVFNDAQASELNSDEDLV